MIKKILKLPALFLAFTFFSSWLVIASDSPSPNTGGQSISNSSASTNPPTVTVTPKVKDVCINETVEFTAVLTHGTTSSWNWYFVNADETETPITQTPTNTDTTSTITIPFQTSGVYKLKCVAAGKDSNIAEVNVFNNYIVTIDKKIACVDDKITVTIKPCSDNIDVNSLNINVETDWSVLYLEFDTQILPPLFRPSNNTRQLTFRALEHSKANADPTPIKLTINGSVEPVPLAVSVRELTGITVGTIFYDVSNNTAKVKLTGQFQNQPYEGTPWSTSTFNAFFDAAMTINQTTGQAVDLHVKLTPGVRKTVTVKAGCGNYPISKDIEFLLPKEGEELQIFMTDFICTGETVFAVALEFNPSTGTYGIPSNITWQEEFRGKASFGGIVGPSIRVQAGDEAAEKLKVIAVSQSGKTASKEFDVVNDGKLSGPAGICIDQNGTLNVKVCHPGKYIIFTNPGSESVVIDGSPSRYIFEAAQNQSISIPFQVSETGKYLLELVRVEGFKKISSYEFVAVSQSSILGKTDVCPNSTHPYTAIACEEGNFRIVLPPGMTSEDTLTFPGPGSITVDVTVNLAANQTGLIKLEKEETPPDDGYDSNNENPVFNVVATLNVEVRNLILTAYKEHICLDREAGAPKKFATYCIEMCDLTMEAPRVFIINDDNQVVKPYRFQTEVPLTVFKDMNGKRMYAFVLEAVGPGEVTVFAKSGVHETNRENLKVEHVRYKSINETKGKDWEHITHYVTPREHSQEKMVTIKLEDMAPPAGGDDSSPSDPEPSEITWTVKAEEVIPGCTSGSEKIDVPEEKIIIDNNRLSLTYSLRPEVYYEVIATYECNGMPYNKRHYITIKDATGVLGSKDTVPFAPSSKYRSVTIHGQPATTIKPQQDKEKDQPDNKFSIDAYNLSATYSTTDISIPLRGSDLRLEFRRTASPDTRNTRGLCEKGVNLDPWKFIMGYGWRTNLTAHLKKHEKGYVVIDENGGSYEYDEYFRPKKSSFSNHDAFKHTLAEDQNGNYIWTKMHGTKYHFSKFVPDPSTPSRGGSISQDMDPCLFLINLIMNQSGASRPEPQKVSGSFLLAKVTDRNGNAIIYEYESGIFPIKMFYEQEPGLFIKYHYEDGTGRLVGAEDPLGRVYTFVYDETSGQLNQVVAPVVGVASESDPDNPVDSSPITSFTYETLMGSSGTRGKVITCLSSITDPEGNTVQLNYQVLQDSQGNSNAHLESIVTPLDENDNPIDGTSQYTFTETQGRRTTTITDTKGNVWTYIFNTQDQTITYSEVVPGADQDDFTEFVLDNFSRQITYDNTDYEMFARFTVGSFGEVNLTEVEDYWGVKFQYQYLGDHSRYGVVTKEIQDPDGLNIIKEFDYGTNWQMSKIIDARGPNENDAVGFTTTYQLDGNGNRTAEFAPEGKTTTFEYELGYQTKAVDADGRTTLSKRFYHEEGWDDVTVVLLNYGDERTYDELGIDYKTYTPSIEDDIILTVQKCDLVGNVRYIIDANRNVTENIYDNMNTVAITKMPAVPTYGQAADVQPQILIYRNANRQVVGKEDARGNLTAIKYDSMLRPIETTVFVSANGASDIITSTSYDDAGNKELFTDARGVVYKFTYDPFNNLIEEIKDFGTGDNFLNLTSTYFYGVHSGNDLFGDSGFVPTKKVDPRGLVTLLEYDNAYRLKRTKRGPAGSEVTLSEIDYDHAGNVVKTTTKNGKISTQTGNYVDTTTGVNGEVSGDQITRTIYDKLNRPTITIVNLQGADADVNDPEDIITQTFYDKAGNVVKVIDPEGHSTQTQYDAAGRVVRQVVNLDYDETTKVDNPAIANLNGNPYTIVVAAEDIETTKFYDDNSNVLEETIINDTPFIADGEETSLGEQTVSKEFDALNRVSSVTDPLDNVTETKYDLNNNVRWVKNARGFETITDYDEANRAFRQTLPAVENAEGIFDPSLNNGTGGYPSVSPVVTTYFDTNSNVIETVDARGLHTVNRYDNLNRLEETRQVIGVNDTDEGSNENDDIVTTNEYDGNNNLISTTFTRNDIDPDTNQPVNVDLVTSTQYDSLDRPLVTTDPEGFQSVVFCDLVGNKIKLFDKRANSLIVGGVETPQETPQLRYFTLVKFDLANRMVKNTLPEIPVASRNILGDVNETNQQPFSEVKYLKNNWVIETKDLNGNITTTNYDGAGRKEKITTAINQITEYKYDKSSNVLEQKVYNDQVSGGDQTTTYIYDKRNLLLSETLNPLEGADLKRAYIYTYDANGNKQTRKFPNGQITTYTYDALDRLTNEVYTGAESENREYKYNLNGAVVIAKDATGLTEYDYDILGRQIEETKKDSAGVVLTVVESVYDKANNRIRCYFPNDKKTLVSFYDKRNLLKIMKGYHGKVADESAYTGVVEQTTYSYNANGQQVSLTTPNTQTTTKTYDNADRIRTSTTSANNLDIYTVTYKRDAVGNQLQATEERYDRPDRVLNFEYDAVYRLTKETDNVSGSNVSTEYQFDLQGNRKNKIVSDSNGAELEVWVYYNNLLNQTTKVEKTVNNVLVKTYDYQYDLNGNRELKTETDNQNSAVVVDHTYNYDRENRLKSVEDPAGDIFTATYDYRTRRVSKAEGTSAAQNTLKATTYIYDGGVTCQETEDVNGTEMLVKQYIRGNGMGGGIGSVLYMERRADYTGTTEAVQNFYDNLGYGPTSTSANSNTVAEYYAYNAVGSVVANTDQQGFVIRENDFDAYGNQVREQDWTSDNFPTEFGGSQNDLLFSTKERDFSTGLDYFGFRYYDAVLGKFTTRDPSGYPDGPNNYLYVNNNPINAIDPLGLNKYATMLRELGEQAAKKGVKGHIWRRHPKTGAAIINKKAVGTPNAQRTTKTGRVVKNDEHGFIRLEEHAHKVDGKEGIVKIDMQGDRSWAADGDFGKANAAASEKLGIKIDRKYMEDNNLTWHHVEDAETMIMAPKDAHALSHVGGVSVIEALKNKTLIEKVKDGWNTTRNVVVGAVLSNTLTSVSEGADGNTIANNVIRDGVSLSGGGDAMNLAINYGEAGAMATEDVGQGLKAVQKAREKGIDTTADLVLNQNKSKTDATENMNGWEKTVWYIFGERYKYVEDEKYHK